MMSYNTRKLKNLKQQCFILTVNYVRKILLNSLLFFEIGNEYYLIKKSRYVQF